MTFMTPIHTTVSTILAEKGSIIHSISHDASVHDAVVEMNQKRIGSILVMRGDQVVGIFTERDVLTRVVESGREAANTMVSEVMTSEIQKLSPDTLIEDAMEIITEKRARHLPVFDESGTLLGLISIGDILRWLIKVNQMESDHLRQYIFGEHSQ